MILIWHKKSFTDMQWTWRLSVLWHIPDLLVISFIQFVHCTKLRCKKLSSIYFDVIWCLIPSQIDSSDILKRMYDVVNWKSSREKLVIIPRTNQTQFNSVNFDTPYLVWCGVYLVKPQISYLINSYKYNDLIDMRRDVWFLVNKYHGLIFSMSMYVRIMLSTNTLKSPQCRYWNSSINLSYRAIFYFYDV